MITRADFLAFYPHLQSFTPQLVLDSYISLANARFGDYDEKADPARRLYAAHNLVLYARALPAARLTEAMSMIASTGKEEARVTQKRVDQVSVSYSYSSDTIRGSAKSTSQGDLPETIYGIQLLSLIKARSFGKYVP